MKEKKKTKHRILGIPVLGPALAAIISFYLAEAVIGGIIGIPLDMKFFGLTLMEAAQLKGVFIIYGGAIGGIIMIFIHKFWFRGELKHCVRGEWGDNKTKICIALVAGAVMLNMVINYVTAGVQAPTVVTIGTSLMAGITEEVCFRMVPISIAMRRSTGRKDVIIAMAVSTVAFGLIHSTNLFMGQSLSGTLMQVLSCFALGLFFGAIYIRTGNLFLTMIFHTVYDFFALMQGGAQGVIMDVGSTSMLDKVLSLSVSLIFIVISVFMLLGSHKQIEQVWNPRWVRAEEQ